MKICEMGYVSRLIWTKGLNYDRSIEISALKTTRKRKKNPCDFDMYFME